MHGIEPDMAVFGKTLGNGYGISAIIGKRAIMEGRAIHFRQQHFLD